ncbi:uncharacterized protein [Chelonus insularis]|uniref:uncharacterized protein n=1 Tax=Chelonus insularis TaxID=460826 RepID=UPI00158E7AEB|nr:uncharacterized protein LOC118065632 [Chelonus insularis]
MNEEKNKQLCLTFFQKYTGKNKQAGFDESLSLLRDVAIKKGLETSDMKIIIKTITEKELRAGLCVPLIQCLIPKNKVSDTALETVIIYWFSKCDDLPVTVSTTILQWFCGLWEHQLADRQMINTYYDCFFMNMLKKEKLQSPISRLIYLMTKPDDVTRRQVLRLLKLQEQYSKPPKHISALLSLFKSYKPEIVPEQIPSLNIESVWKPIPEILRLGFEDAKSRGTGSEVKALEYFDWNAIKTKDGPKSYPLLPSIRYFQMGSSIERNKDAKFLFDLNNIDDIGKNHFNTELPSNATSLLANMAGYHFLTFSTFEYQCRFSYNLYNTLRRAFIIESNRFSHNQKVQLLDLTTEFCRYMQQGIPVVVRFLQEYLLYETGAFRDKLLLLMEWSTLISVIDLQDMSSYLETIFLESSLKEKCKLINSLGKLAINMYVNQRFDRERPLKPSPFLGQEPISELTDIIPMILKIADYLITKGLNIHQNHCLFLSEALKFYETINKLAKYCIPPMLIIAPPAVIYGGFLSKSASILSRVCGLLLDYKNIHNHLEELNLRKNYIPEIKSLQIYAQDIGDALWNDQISIGRSKSYLFSSLTSRMIENMPEKKNLLLNINNHIAILSYKCILNDTGVDISTKDAALYLSNMYFPLVTEFISSFQEFQSENQFHALKS